jgi:hypothetical protein
MNSKIFILYDNKIQKTMQSIARLIPRPLLQRLESNIAVEWLSPSKPVRHAVHGMFLANPKEIRTNVTVKCLSQPRDRIN